MSQTFSPDLENPINIILKTLQNYQLIYLILLPEPAECAGACRTACRIERSGRPAGRFWLTALPESAGRPARNYALISENSGSRPALKSSTLVCTCVRLYRLYAFVCAGVRCKERERE